MNHRNSLIARVVMAGEELISHPQDFVPNLDNLDIADVTDFTINLYFKAGRNGFDISNTVKGGTAKATTKRDILIPKTKKKGD